MPRPRQGVDTPRIVDSGIPRVYPDEAKVPHAALAGPPAPVLTPQGPSDGLQTGQLGAEVSTVGLAEEVFWVSRRDAVCRILRCRMDIPGNHCSPAWRSHRVPLN